MKPFDAITDLITHISLKKTVWQQQQQNLIRLTPTGMLTLVQLTTSPMN